jgi:glycosyltransferase involved in cell wall biosynthesis
VQGISFDCSNAVQVAGTPSDFAESVLFFLENETIRQKYGNNARGFVKKYYDWQQNMQHLEECILG